MDIVRADHKLTTMKALLILLIFVTFNSEAQYFPYMSNALPGTGWAFYPGNHSPTGVSISGGGTRILFTNASQNICIATLNGAGGKSTGQWYWEFVVTNGGGPINAGVMSGLTVGNYTDYLGIDPNGFGYYSISGGWWYQNCGLCPVFNACGTANWSVTNDIVGFALDAGANSIDIYLNNTYQCTQTISGGNYYPAVSSIQTNVITAHFTTASFTYTPPGSYIALN